MLLYHPGYAIEQRAITQWNKHALEFVSKFQKLDRDCSSSFQGLYIKTIFHKPLSGL